jgi:uncharacterized protein (TIGR02001 family)
VHAGAGWRAAPVPRWLLDGTSLRGVVALLICIGANGAAAQFSGTASGVTDYRYRGITFSDRKPAAQTGFTYDDATGWYAGAFGSTVQMSPPRGPTSYFQAIAYAGYAKRLPGGISVEAGGDYSAFAGENDINYGEVYVGASTDNLSARVYFSPQYFGQSSNAVYGEIDATQPLIERVRLRVHVGFLRYRYESPYDPMRVAQPTQNVVDGRIGLRIDFNPLQLEIAWVGVSNHTVAYVITGSSSPNTVVAALSLSF